jgi:hypothetical protein
VNSRATARFWRCFEALPADIQRQAEGVYHVWTGDPFHRSLEFKRIHGDRPIYSVRIGLHWRALAIWEGDDVTWFWIGSHAQYDSLIRRR